MIDYVGNEHRYFALSKMMLAKMLNKISHLQIVDTETMLTPAMQTMTEDLYYNSIKTRYDMKNNVRMKSVRNINEFI